MLQLDKIIRQNAITPFDNPNRLNSKVEFNVYDDQVKEALEVIIKSQKYYMNTPLPKLLYLQSKEVPTSNI